MKNTGYVVVTFRHDSVYTVTAERWTDSIGWQKSQQEKRRLEKKHERTSFYTCRASDFIVDDILREEINAQYTRTFEEGND